MILFWYKKEKAEQSHVLLERALLAYCAEIGKKTPRKKNRSVAYGTHGKPYYPVLSSVFFSISHSGDLWICCFDGQPLGIDVELCSGKAHNFDAVIRRRFRPEEQALFAAEGGQAVHSPEAERLFYRIWTRKEAYLKYTGEGLTRELTTVPVLDAEGRFLERVSGRYETESEAVLPEWVFYREVALQERPEAVITLCGSNRPLQVRELPKPDPQEALTAAKEIALDFLETRERTAGEVQKKLAEKNVDAETAEQVLAFLKEYHYVDDGAYAKRFAEWEIEKGRGPVRIRQELIRKGVSPELAKGVLEDRSFREDALTVARKALREGEKPDDKVAARILRKLAAQGFTAADAYEAINRLRSEAREQS